MINKNKTNKVIIINLIYFFIIMNTNNNALAKTLSDITPDDLPSLTSLPETSSSSATDKSSFFSNITWQTWIIIILILAFLGINVFVYLGKGLQEITTFFSPILKLFGYEVLETTKQTIDVSATGTKAGINLTAEGAKTGIDIVADTTTGAIDLATGVSGKQASSSLSTQTNIDTDYNADIEQNNIQNALNDAKQSQEVMPDDSKSSIQTTSGKSGWCYIGEDRGIRSCSQVGVNDMCMSGDIFPSNEICINPNLRP
jgi:hypothetical protein